MLIKPKVKPKENMTERQSKALEHFEESIIRELLVTNRVDKMILLPGEKEEMEFTKKDIIFVPNSIISEEEIAWIISRRKPQKN